jgi:hypothetical protein
VWNLIELPDRTQSKHGLDIRPSVVEAPFVRARRWRSHFSDKFRMSPLSSLTLPGSPCLRRAVHRLVVCISSLPRKIRTTPDTTRRSSPRRRGHERNSREVRALGREVYVPEPDSRDKGVTPNSLTERASKRAGMRGVGRPRSEPVVRMFLFRHFYPRIFAPAPVFMQQPETLPAWRRRRRAARCISNVVGSGSPTVGVGCLASGFRRGLNVADKPGRACFPRSPISQDPGLRFTTVPGTPVR